MFIPRDNSTTTRPRPPIFNERKIRRLSLVSKHLPMSLVVRTKRWRHQFHVFLHICWLCKFHDLKNPRLLALKKHEIRILIIARISSTSAVEEKWRDQFPLAAARREYYGSFVEELENGWLGWWLQIFLFTRIWGKDPIWLMCFQPCWNHQLGGLRISCHIFCWEKIDHKLWPFPNDSSESRFF